MYVLYTDTQTTLTITTNISLIAVFISATVIFMETQE